MDLTQTKLTKSEWNNTEVPVQDNEKFILSISETLSPALSGHLGDDKIGPLTTVAMCHSIAQLISPSGVLVRKIPPWAISGNWIHACMDMTYDPVYVSLKELLIFV